MSIAEQVTRAKADLDAVYAAGKQAEREAWWDAFTQNGTRTNFRTAINGPWWDDTTYNPTRVLAPVDGYQMFMNSKIKNRKIEVDLSNCTDATWMFRSSTVQHIGVCDFRKANSPLMHPFSFCQSLHTIDEVIVNETLAFSGVFAYAPKLVNMKVTGTIAQEGWNTKDCTNLSRASHESIMAAVSTTAAITVTFGKVAVDKAFETTAGANDGSTSPEWLALVETRPLCTVALA